MVSGHPVKLLILTGYLHCPPISGGVMRMVNPIIKLVDSGSYEVTYLFQWLFDDEVRRAESFFTPYPQVNLIGICNQNRTNVRERNLQLEIPREVFNAMDLAYYRELERLLQTEQFDLVQVEHSWMSWVVPLIRKIHPDLPVILDLHNIEAILFQRWIQYGSDSEQEEMAIRYEKTLRWEEETWQWFDACLAVSLLELQTYKEKTGCQIPAWELPSGGGIDLSRFPRTTSLPRREKETILSLGTLEWSANTHGLLWFTNEVMPLLKQTHPHACLRIAGFGTPGNEFVQRISGSENIKFLGELEDERPMLSQSSIFIVPLWIGAGARVKILTAWAAGIPVVATTIGAEGLDCTDGENILIADEPCEFAEKIANLMGDEALALRLSQNGRALVEERYSLDYATREYEQVYGSIIERASFPATSQYIDHNFVEKEKSIHQLIQLKADMPVMLGIRKHEGSLSTTQHSLIRKKLSRYNKVINKLLPQGTRRRGAFDLALIGVRTIANEGWRSFFRKIMIWLKLRMSKGVFHW